MALVRVYKPVTDGYTKGFVVVYPKPVDKLMTFLWNHGFCHKLITKLVHFHIQQAKKTGEFSYCEVISKDNDLK